ncbi:MAG TPA: PsbP-related protein [Tepidisphaeraceae bacterium]
MKHHAGHLLLAVLFVVSLAPMTGCRHRAASAATARTQSVGVPFNHKHFSFTYPTGWVPRRDTNAENVVTLNRPKTDLQSAEITVAVPKLPAHIPGLIPLNMVEKGYVDDLRKHYRDVVETQSDTTKLDGSPARRFSVTGNDQAGARKLAVVAGVRNDSLYIITLDARAEDFNGSQPAFEQIIKTWSWTK